MGDTQDRPAAARLTSIDALRGFDMMWIIGGSTLVAALAADFDVPGLGWVAAQCHHAEWHGFTFWDLIFPFFLFLAGVSTPLSFKRRIEDGATRADLVRHCLRRGLTLVVLGVVYNGLLQFDFETLRYASVLGRIGLAWMIAAIAVLFLSWRGLLGLCLALLLGYWAALSLIPVPGFGAGDLSPGATLTDWVDRQFLPGRLHRTVRDPEGLLSTLPAVVTALMGVFTGRLLSSGLPAVRRLAWLGAAGLACLALGKLMDPVFPINKNLWSSSFVLWTGGWSLLLVAAAHLLIDVLGWRRLALPFVVIGRNAITIYLLGGLINFGGIAELVFEGARVHPAWLAGGGLGLRWLFLWGLHRKRWYLRV